MIANFFLGVFPGDTVGRFSICLKNLLRAVLKFIYGSIGGKSCPVGQSGLCSFFVEMDLETHFKSR